MAFAKTENGLEQQLMLFAGILIVLFAAGCKSDIQIVKVEETIQQVPSPIEYCHPPLEKKTLTDFCKETLSRDTIGGKKISEGYSCIVNVGKTPENACPSGTHIVEDPLRFTSDELNYLCSGSTPFQATCLPGYDVVWDHSQEPFELDGDYEMGCAPTDFSEYYFSVFEKIYVFDVLTTGLAEEEMKESKSLLNETILQLNQYFCVNTSATVVVDSYENESKIMTKRLAITGDHFNEYCCFYSEK